jgi:hypothetical protein
MLSNEWRSGFDIVKNILISSILVLLAAPAISPAYSQTVGNQPSPEPSEIQPKPTIPI